MNLEKNLSEIFNKSYDIFEHKLKDYGATFRVMETISIADQLYIKIMQLKNIIKSKNKSKELIKDNIISLINYSIIGIIQNQHYIINYLDYDYNKYLEKYKTIENDIIKLLKEKNELYGNAWQWMEPISIIDLIFVKILRMKHIIIKNNGKTSKYSEGIENSFYDIVGYSIYLYIKLYK